eukprot:gb/GECG01010358.1/.p1 GENE.gb/GECG01010358.1/~~gb/GECG01010358.1/.p1  ORF type:complete len:296 (+),score=22.65 gb/GECG01010358.1/:1-888(+)
MTMLATSLARLGFTQGIGGGHSPGSRALTRTFGTLVGKYAYIRRNLDHRYHSKFTAERQELQDSIVDDLLAQTDGKQSTTTLPWIVYSAGPMGAGKSHTLRWLKANDLFPLDDFIYLDPDAIKYRLPEWVHLRSSNPESAATVAHKESGYICELAERRACELGRCVLIDGSLRDSEWYKKEFRRIRREFPKYRIAIIHVMASRDTVTKRAEKRGTVTGRHVPSELVLLAYQQVPISVAQLAPLADYVAHIDNDGLEPCILAPSNQQEFKTVWRSSEVISSPNYCTLSQRPGATDR